MKAPEKASEVVKNITPLLKGILTLQGVLNGTMRPDHTVSQDLKGSAEQGDLACQGRALCLITGQDVMEEDPLQTLTSLLTH